MDLRFYRTGTIAKDPIHPKDIEDIAALLTRLKPHQIYVAGELSDPHGTHRMCAEAIFAAVRRTCGHRAGVRGVAVPRRLGGVGAARDRDGGAAQSRTCWSGRSRRSSATSRRRTGRCSPAAPTGASSGSGPRTATSRTAKIYDALGLPEFYALEAFVKWKDG